MADRFAAFYEVNNKAQGRIVVSIYRNYIAGDRTKAVRRGVK